MKKNILFVMQHLNGGGAEKVLIDILRNFNYELYNVDLLLIFEEGVYLKDIPNEVNIISIIKSFILVKKVPGKVQKLFTKYIKNNEMNNLYKKFVKKKYDVEIAFLEGISTKFVASSYNKESKKIAWVHTDLLNNHWTDLYFKNLAEEINVYDKFEKIVCVSEYAKRAFLKKFGDFKTADVIYNALDINNIRNKASEKLEANERFTICSVGRLVPQKGFDRLINVAKMLKQEEINIKFQIIGRGSKEKELLKMIKEYKLQDSVNIVGFTKNPYKYINNCDVFVCSSRNEGFSLVVAEAIILNKTIISTRCAGPVELLNDGEFGIIVDNTEAELYNSIKQIYFDNDKIKYYEEKTKERINFFDIEEKMNQIYKLL